MNRRSFLKVSAAGTAAAYLATRARFLRRAYGATQVNAIPLPGSLIPQFVDELPDFVLVSGDNSLTIRMQEFKADVMPSSFVPTDPATGAVLGDYLGTWVWGYQTNNNPTPTVDRTGGTFKTTYINPVILANRGTPTEITWVNELGTGAGSSLYWEDWTDLTMHWANPTNLPMMIDNPIPPPAMIGNNAHYTGSVPVVPHLHGGEVPPQLDGGPDAWFTSDGLMVGHAFYSKDWDGMTPQKWAIYRYPNTQEGATIWFHDHALGITRINVYAGLAGAYLLEDGNHPTNLPPLIPLVIQDRQFDLYGQLYFPNIGDNPFLHPFWVPEFIGDTIVVNGKVWPYKAVDRKRYTLFFLNGSNARFYDMFLIDTLSGVKGPPMYVISTDGGYLDNAVKIDPNASGRQTKAGFNKSLILGTGERYQVIVDFNDATWLASITAAYTALSLPDPVLNGGTVNLHLRNNARTPFPGGVPAPNGTTGRVMEFRVNLAPVVPDDTSFNPDTGVTTTPIQAAVRNTSMVCLTTSTVTRLLTLNEVMGPAGPYEALVNNTKWDGHSVHKADGTNQAEVNGVTFDADGVRSDFVVGPDGHTYYSELPQEGVTELWEIVNLTADAHPIHLHLVQFQLLNRQDFDAGGYAALYDGLFPASTAIDPMTGVAYPGGVFIGGYGPPLAYNSGGKLGGNPDVTPYLAAKKGVQLVQLPLAHEKGWKDTVIMYPGQVTRILVRWAPTDLATNTPAADLHFPFDPNGGHGFVWHCHIIDHEDNEMMRPDAVVSIAVTIGTVTFVNDLEVTVTGADLSLVQIGMSVKNVTDGSMGRVTAVNTTLGTVTTTALTGGTNNVWAVDDLIEIGPPRDFIKGLDY